MTLPEYLKELILDNEQVAIVSHVLPDGDSIGASIALCLGLEKNGKNVQLFCYDDVPRKYRFLKGAERFQKKMNLHPDTLVIVLDCSDLDRVGSLQKQLVNHKIINIDHHTTNEFFGCVNYVDISASATGELIFFILQELKLPLDKDISTAIYVAIATDTGSFKFENTTPRTFRVAASLLEHGVNPSMIAIKVFDDRPLSAVCLLSRTLETLEFTCNQRIAILTITAQMLSDCQAGNEDMDGIINYAKNIEGVEVGILFFLKGEREVKVGFRSKNIDVSAVAKKFNGGGHLRAAGCQLQGNCEELKNKVISAVENALSK